MRDKTKGRKKPAEKPKRNTLKSSKALAPSRKASYKSKPIKKPKNIESRQTLVVNSTTYKAKASLKVIKTKDLKEEKKERESSLPKKYNTKKLLLLKETSGLEEPYMPANYIGRKDGKL